MCVTRALRYAGRAALVIHLCLCTRKQRCLFLVFFCGCGLAGTPLHIPLLGLGAMRCPVSCAAPAYNVTMMMSSNPSYSRVGGAECTTSPYVSHLRKE